MSVPENNQLLTSIHYAVLMEASKKGDFDNFKTSLDKLFELGQTKDQIASLSSEKYSIWSCLTERKDITITVCNKNFLHSRKQPWHHDIIEQDDSNSDGQLECFKYLHEKGFNCIKKPKDDDDHLMHFNMSIKWMEFFLKIGGDIDIIWKRRNDPPLTPLMVAIKERNYEYARWLVEHGANLNFSLEPFFHPSKIETFVYDSDDELESNDSDYTDPSYEESYETWKRYWLKYPLALRLFFFNMQIYKEEDYDFLIFMLNNKGLDRKYLDPTDLLFCDISESYSEKFTFEFLDDLSQEQKRLEMIPKYYDLIDEDLYQDTLYEILIGFGNGFRDRSNYFLIDLRNYYNSRYKSNQERSYYYCEIFRFLFKKYFSRFEHDKFLYRQKIEKMINAHYFFEIILEIIHDESKNILDSLDQELEFLYNRINRKYQLPNSIQQKITHYRISSDLMANSEISYIYKELDGDYIYDLTKLKILAHRIKNYLKTEDTIICFHEIFFRKMFQNFFNGFCVFFKIQNSLRIDLIPYDKIISKVITVISPLEKYMDKFNFDETVMHWLVYNAGSLIPEKIDIMFIENRIFPFLLKDLNVELFRTYMYIWIRRKPRFKDSSINIMKNHTYRDYLTQIVDKYRDETINNNNLGKRIRRNYQKFYQVVNQLEI